MELIRFTSFPTPYGSMVAAASARGICRLLPPGQGMDDLVRWLARHAPGATLEPDEAADQGLREQVPEYLAGRRRAFAVPLDLRGTAFQRAVWRAVGAIPYGETRSYADIARAVGHPSAWRAVGAANAANPVCLVIPCHRVIGADGTVKGYAGGVLSRHLLLAIERSRHASPIPVAGA